MAESDVEIAVSDDVVLSGTLTTPDRARAAALILSGSGPLDRNSNMPGQALNIANALAARLGRRGVASLRFDKRGVGRSGGDYLATGFIQEADDAAAVLQVLRATAPSPFVVGHSVGATIAMRLAGRDAGLGGAVLLSAACRSGEQVMRTQSQRIAETMRWPARLLAPLFLWRQAEIRRRLSTSTGDILIERRVELPARWLREYMAHNPEGDLRAIRCPVLAITGAGDVQVEPGDVACIGEMVSGQFTGWTPDGVSHLLRRSVRRGLAAYPEELRRPVDEGVLIAITEWIEAQI